MKKLIVSFCIIAFVLTAMNKLYAQNASSTIIQNVTTNIKKNYTVSSSFINSGTTTILNSLGSNGAWTDLAYSVTSSGDVPYNTHITRIRQMAVAYTFQGGTYYNSSALYNKLVLALQYWNNNTHVAANWWYNQISYPQLLGELLILMRNSNTSALPVSEESKVLVYLSTRDHPSLQTGANKADEALHWIYRGALTDSADVINVGFVQLQSVMMPVSSGLQGINPDLSFLQHDAQLMNHSYGSDYLDAVYTGMLALKGTNYVFGKDEIDFVYRFATVAYYGPARGKYKDFNLSGRSIARVDNNGEISSNLVLKAMQADTAHATDFNDAYLRIIGSQPPGYNLPKPLNRHFWTGDYTMHNRSAYSFSVRCASTRTIRAENLNGENLLGTWLTEGATCIRVSGSEYFNIFPVWNWSMIPGTTMRQFATAQKNSTAFVTGNTSFVGGVSDSVYGASVYVQNNGGVKATKAWFYFDNEVVCLGSGIQSSQSENVVTTVNQTLLSGNVTYKSSGTTTDLGTNAIQNFSNSLSWVYHRNVGYYFPSGGNITVSNQPQSGSWSLIKTGASSTTINTDVFKLWFNHGVQPANVSYAYIVIPGISSAAQMDTYDASKIEIISNTPSVQAVKHQGLNIVAVVFAAAGTLNIPGAALTSVTVDKPCALLIKKTNTTDVDVHISDPAQANNTINLSLQFTGSVTKSFTCSMPLGNFKGSTLKVNSTNNSSSNASYIAVLRIGGTNGNNGLTGTSTLLSSGTPVHIDKYEVTANAISYVSSIDLNAGNAGDKIFMSQSLNEGYLTLSENKQWLSFMGYASKPASGNIYNTTTATIPRTLGMVKYDGAVNLSTALVNFQASGTAATAQSSVTSNGTNLWCVTSQGSGMGVLYTVPGSVNAAASPSVVVSSANVSNRSLGIFGNDLYYTANTGNRIGMVSSTGGLPTTTGNTMPGLTIAAGSTALNSFSPSQTMMFDMDITVPGYDVMYITNVSATTTLAGICKYCKQPNGEWVSYGTYGNIGTDGSYFGITGTIENGLPLLYATCGVSSSAVNLGTNKILMLKDKNGYNTVMDGLLISSIGADISGKGGAIRGIAFYPGETYYYKGSGNINELSSWVVNTDGTGNSPLSFTASNQTFIIANTSNVSFSGNLIISGNQSKLILGDGLNNVSLTIPANYYISADMDVYHKAELNIQNTNLPDLHYLSATSIVKYAAATDQQILSMAYANLSNLNNSSSVVNGTVTVSGSFLQNGILKGNGIVNAANTVVNNGVIAPGLSTGSLTFNSSFTNAANGIIEVELNGDSIAGVSYDQLVISGKTVLNGTLTIKLIEDYTPAVGKSFTVISSGDTISGSFTNVIWPAGITGTVTYNLKEVVITISSVLPLQQLSFIGLLQPDATVKLSWKTEQEINMHSYVIERSFGTGTDFQTIGVKPTQGNGNYYYEFIDQFPVKGINIYRLKMINKDGSFSYSKTVVIHVDKKEAAIKIYPNPARNIIHIQHKQTGINSNLQIFSIDGKPVMHKPIQAGATETILNVRALQPGVYSVYITDASEGYRVLFVKE